MIANLSTLDSLHLPMALGLSGLLGLGELSLSVNKANIPVGETGIFYIRGGPPNAKIYWSSKKNGLPTGEDLAHYGQSTDAAGNADLVPTAWSENTIGEWIKYVVIYDSSGRPYSAGVAFNVVPKVSKPTIYVPIPGGASIPVTTTAVDPGPYIDPLIVPSIIPPSPEPSGSQTSPSPSSPSTGTPTPSLPGYQAPSLPGYQPPSSNSSFFSKKFSLFGFQVPYYLPIAVGAGYFLLQKKR